MSAPTPVTNRPSQSDFETTDEESIYTKEFVASIVDDQFNEKHNVFNIAPPLRESLSARYRRSFAYKTFRERVPKMLQELVICLQENEVRMMEQCGDYARFDLRRVIWSLDILYTEILKNNEFKLFYDKEPDAKDWNKLLVRMKEQEKNQWFSADWMNAECYFYRRIWAMFRRTETLQNYDYFSPYKICAARNIVYLMDNVLKGTRQLTRSCKNFQLMLKLSLWGNRCDLSITKEQPSAQMMQVILDYDAHLLADESEQVWRLLTQGALTSPVIVDIVLDNAGYEVFTDLLLAEYLIDSGLAHKVRFHVKAIPWFISDVTTGDFHWMLRFFHSHEIPILAEFGRKLQSFIRQRSMELYDICHFWTSPYGFKCMRQRAPCLYVHLSLGALVIFKGDLNYRKLLDDVNWVPTTPFSECLGGFLPTSVCALRAIKSDIYCGMPLCSVEWLTEDNPNWMQTGEKAVIQLAIKSRP